MVDCVDPGEQARKKISRIPKTKAKPRWVPFDVTATCVRELALPALPVKTLRDQEAQPSGRMTTLQKKWTVQIAAFGLRW
jgi:hypothetical protein